MSNARFGGFRFGVWAFGIHSAFGIRHSAFWAAVFWLAAWTRLGAAETTPLEIVPTPREVKQAADQPLGPAILVLPTNPSEKMRIAAEEINLRLKELGATPLPVATAAVERERVERKALSVERKPQEAKDAPRSTLDAASPPRLIYIRLADAGSGAVPREEQGYWIDTRDAREARLVGRGEQGLLWAAVTFRRMLVAGRDGGVVLLAAEVRDWPDFPMRMMNRFSAYYRERTERGLYEAIQKGGEEAQRYADGYVADSLRTVDFLFRLKLNLTWLPIYGQPERLDAFTKSIGGEAKAAQFLAALRRVTDYARARGITVASIQMADISTSPEDDGLPDPFPCVHLRSQGRKFCWSLDDANRRKAEETAKYLARAGYSLVALHDVDGGGYGDPVYWSRRCKTCRERWGDDRSAATAHLYALWHDAFRKHAPGVSLAAIQYPYDASILIEKDHPEYERTCDFWAALGRRLPGNPSGAGVPPARQAGCLPHQAGGEIAVCVRENIRPAIAEFYRIFDSRPALVYWMTDTMEGDHRWNPVFSSRVRCAKTFLRGASEVPTPPHDGKRDAYPPEAWAFASSSSCAPMSAIAAAQYLWNSETWGADLWPGRLDVDRDGKEPAVFFDTLLPAFAGELFGKRAAPALLEVFQGCISPSYCVLPSDVARMCFIPNSADRMQQQYDALVRAYGGLERLWQRIEGGEKDALAPGSEPYFYGLSEQVGRARAWASFHLARMRAPEALRQGQRDPRPILDNLESAIQRFTADAALAGRMDARVRDRPKGGKADTNRWLRDSINARYYNTDYAKLLAELERLKGVIAGNTVQLVEPEANSKTVRLLLPADGREVRPRSKGSTVVSLVSDPVPEGGRHSVQIEGLTEAWSDGLAVSFPPVDVSELRRAGAESVLRFYVNGGGSGNQQLTFWLYARSKDAPPDTEAKGWLWVNLRDYVAIDDLEATWQLVSIPLDRLVRAEYPVVSGFGMNNAVENEVCGPLWISGMYVARNGEPVERIVPVRAPPAQPPARSARLTPIGIQPTMLVGAAGLESRLLFGLKLDADGSLSNVRISVRLVAPDGQAVLSALVCSAERMRTPWWSTSLQFDLGRLVPQARVELALASAEFSATFVTSIRW